MDVYACSPDVAEVIDPQMLIKSGQWLPIGVAEMAVAWFGLRLGQSWAMWTLAGANALAVFGWGLVVVRYLQRGAYVDLDLPPVIFLWPLFVAPVATVLGWIGMQ